MLKKYEFVEDDTIRIDNQILTRIRALVPVGKGFSITPGSLGGYIANAKNLSCNLADSAWVNYDAKVYDDARVNHHAQIFGNACVYGSASVYGRAEISGYAKIYNRARVHGDALISGSSEVYGNSWIHQHANISGKVQIGGHVIVYGDSIITSETLFVLDGAAQICNAKIYSETDVSWIPNTGPDSLTITAYKTANGGIGISHDSGYPFSGADGSLNFRGSVYDSIEDFEKSLPPLFKKDPKKYQREYVLLLAYIRARLSR